MRRKVIVVFLMISLIFKVVLVTTPLQAEEKLIFTTVESSLNQNLSEKVLLEAYKRLGIQFEVQRRPGERALKEANAGIFDGEVSRIKGIDKKFPNLIMIPIAVNYLEATVFAKNVEFTVKGWGSLKPYTIGRLRGVKFVENNTKEMRTVVANNYEQLFGILDKGRVDVVVAPLINGLSTIDQFKLKGISILAPRIIQMNLYHYLHRKRKNLVPRITSVLEEMEKDGSIATLRDKFIAELK